MDIFSRRPLFISCMLFIAFSVAGLFIPGEIKIISAIICVISLIFCLILALIRYHSSKRKNLFLSLILCFITSGLALLSSYFHFDLNTDKFVSMYGNEYSIDAVVTSKDYESDFLSQYTVKIETVNGEKKLHKAILMLDFSGELEIGDRIKANVVAQDPTENALTTEQINVLKSDGIFISYSCENIDSIDVTQHAETSPELLFININKKLSETLTRTVGGEAGNLSSALLLGNKNLLSPSVKRDFNRAGASHILALSGMHMSIIMGVFMLILKRITSKTRLIAIALAVISVFYLLITGVSISATRSVLMLLIVYLSWICFGTADSLTSLSIAGVLILLFSPGAIFDSGFWMSYSATFGILVFIQPLNKYFNECLSKYDNKFKWTIHKIFYSIITAFATGLAAIIPLIIVMCIFTKKISLFSVLSSVVLSIPTAAIILLSLFLLPFAQLPFVSDMIVLLIRIAAKLMFNYCEFISMLDGVVISINYPFAVIMAIALGIALLFALLSKKFNPFASLIPFAVCILVFTGVAIGYEYVNSDQVKVTYINASSNSDMIVVSTEREAVICELSNGSSTSFSKALAELDNVRATDINAIVLTRYMNQNVATLYQTFQNNRVREIWMPKPTTSAEYYLMERLYSFAKEQGVEPYVYENGENLHILNSVSLELYRDHIDRSTVPVSLVSISSGNQLLTYVSPGFNESDLSERADYFFTKSYYVIFGNRGPRTKSEYTITYEKRLIAIAFAGEDQIAYFKEPEYIYSSYYMVPQKIDFYLDK